MSKLHIEKTTSWQVEDSKGSYCATTYSSEDAKVVSELANDIPNLKCLSESDAGKQPKGHYIYKTIGSKKFPIVEVYDKRLAKKVRNNLAILKGE